MRNDLPASDQAVLDRLLTEISVRLTGAVDYWPTVILGSFPPGPQEFVRHHSEVLRSLVVVTRAILAETDRADAQPERGFLDRMAAACQQLERAFLSLDQFRTLAVEDLHGATRTVADAYTTLRQSIRGLSDTLGLSLSYWKEHGEETESYCKRILGGLFDQFRHERETGELAAATPPPAGTGSGEPCA